MTTLENRPHTALLVVDVQNGVVEGAHERDAVVANVASLVEKARRERVPVIWVQHSDEQIVKGSDDWRIVPELTPGDAEPLVEKTYGDSFEDTTLETVLSGALGKAPGHALSGTGSRHSNLRSAGLSRAPPPVAADPCATMPPHSSSAEAISSASIRSSAFSGMSCMSWP